MAKQYHLPKPKRRRPRPSYTDDTQWRLQRPARRLARLRKPSEIGAGVNRSVNRTSIRRRLRHVRIEEIQKAVGYNPEDRKVRVAKPRHAKGRRTGVGVSKPTKAPIVKQKKGRQWTDAQRQAQSVRRKAIWKAKQKQKEFVRLNNATTQSRRRQVRRDLLSDLVKRTHGLRVIKGNELINTKTGGSIDINDPGSLDFFGENVRRLGDEAMNAKWADRTMLLQSLYQYIVEKYPNRFVLHGMGRRAWSKQLREALWEIGHKTDDPEEFVARARHFADELEQRYEKYGELMDAFFDVSSHEI